MKLHPNRRQVLIDLDVEAVRAEFVARVGPPAEPDAIEASLHKARILAGRSIPRHLRRESVKWLGEHGYEVPDTTKGR